MTGRGRRVSAFAALAAACLAGVVLTLAVIRLADHQRGGRRGPSSPDGRPQSAEIRRSLRGADPRFLARGELRSLDLTPDQWAHIEEALAHSRTSAREVMGGARRRLQANMDSLRVEIASVLTPEQLRDYDEMRRRQEQRRNPPSQH